MLSLAAFTGISAENVKAQSYVPGYLQDNSFIAENFAVIDSSGWFIALPESDISFTNFISQYKQYFGMGSDDGFTLTRTTNDDYPFMAQERRLTHHRFNQTYKGVPVEYAELFLHHKNDRIESVNCKLAESLNFSVTPAITATGSH